jgi:hypothetical protein
LQHEALRQNDTINLAKCATASPRRSGGTISLFKSGFCALFHDAPAAKNPAAFQQRKKAAIRPSLPGRSRPAYGLLAVGLRDLPTSLAQGMSMAA